MFEIKGKLKGALVFYHTYTKFKSRKRALAYYSIWGNQGTTISPLLRMALRSTTVKWLSQELLEEEKPDPPPCVVLSTVSYKNAFPS